MHQGKSHPPRRRSHLIAAVISALFSLLFAVLAFVAPTFSQLSERTNFTQLDREGVINSAALAKFHSSYGFGDISTLDYRRTVADYIAQASLAAERRNAQLGLAFALANTILWSVVWWRPPRAEAA